MNISPERDVKPFSMSSTDPLNPGDEGNSLIESIFDDVPLTRPTYSPNAIWFCMGMEFDPISIIQFFDCIIYSPLNKH